MGNKRLPVLAILTLANFLSGNPALASPAPQSKRSKSDADINAIGHRKIAHDPNFYSPEHEKDLGKTQSRQVEQASKLITYAAVTSYLEARGAESRTQFGCSFPYFGLRN
jgi:hypothetical protein